MSREAIPGDIVSRDTIYRDSVSRDTMRRDIVCRDTMSTRVPFVDISTSSLSKGNSSFPAYYIILG